jgi:hypothetical protein
VSQPKDTQVVVEGQTGIQQLTSDPEETRQDKGSQQDVSTPKDAQVVVVGQTGTQQLTSVPQETQVPVVSQQEVQDKRQNQDKPTEHDVSEPKDKQVVVEGHTGIQQPTSVPEQTQPDKPTEQDVSKPKDAQVVVEGQTGIQQPTSVPEETQVPVQPTTTQATPNKDTITGEIAQGISRFLSEQDSNKFLSHDNEDSSYALSDVDANSWDDDSDNDPDHQNKNADEIIDQDKIIEAASK